MRISPFIFLLVLAGACTSQVDALEENVEFLRYSLKEVESLTIPKNHREDRIGRINISSEGFISNYSFFTDTMSVYNLITQDLKKYKLIDGAAKAKNARWCRYNDSLILVYYRDRDIFIDNHLFFLNTITEKKRSIKTPNPIFLSRDKISIDSLRKNMKLVRYKTSFGTGRPFCNMQSGILLIPLITGSDNAKYGDLRSVAKCILKVNLKDETSELLDISFSMVNSVFNDSFSVECAGSLFNFTPSIEQLDDSTALVYFKIAKDFVAYNSESDSIYTVNGFPNFLNHDSNLFVNKSTTDMESVYSYIGMYNNLHSDYLIRRIKIPLWDSSSKSSLNRSERRYIVYEKKPNLKAIGIIDEDINGYIIGIDGDNNIYVCDRKLSDKNPDNFIIRKCQIVLISKSYGFYTPSLKKSSKSKKGEYADYLFEISPDLIKNDTIPLLVNYAACGPCIAKLGIYMEGLDNNNLKSKPSILVSSSNFQRDKFYNDYHITSVNGIFSDTTSLLLNYMEHPNAFGYFIKEKNNYRFEKVSINDLDKLFKFINPKIKMAGKVCIPIKD